MTQLPVETHHTDDVKNWKPEYTVMVYMKLANAKLQDIADKTGYSKGMISRILNSKPGKAKLAEIMGRVELALQKDLESSLVNLAEKALENIRVTIEAPIPITALKAKIHQDNISMKLLDMVRGSNDGLSTAPLLSETDAADLVQAITLADVARLPREVEAVDVTEEVKKAG